VFVTAQGEISADSIRGDKLLEQRSGKLDGLPGGATNHNVPGGPAIIVQVLIRRDAEIKFVSVVHGTSLCCRQQSLNRAGRQARRRGYSDWEKSDFDNRRHVVSFS
jgi:hypothetical protein